MKNILLGILLAIIGFCVIFALIYLLGIYVLSMEHDSSIGMAFTVSSIPAMGILPFLMGALDRRL